eukprot:FR743177.1.p1 GENE.FR743177.1~~FR743177.1.p1  ORF type:complete len:296 (+),score=40.47 FR743177.1:73-888(+)
MSELLETLTSDMVDPRWMAEQSAAVDVWKTANNYVCPWMTTGTGDGSGHVTGEDDFVTASPWSGGTGTGVGSGPYAQEQAEEAESTTDSASPTRPSSKDEAEDDTLTGAEDDADDANANDYVADDYYGDGPSTLESTTDSASPMRPSSKDEAGDDTLTGAEDDADDANANDYVADDYYGDGPSTLEPNAATESRSSASSTESTSSESSTESTSSASILEPNGSTESRSTEKRATSRSGTIDGDDGSIEVVPIEGEHGRDGAKDDPDDFQCQ